MGGDRRGRDKKYMRRLQTIVFLLRRLINGFCDDLTWHKKMEKKTSLLVTMLVVVVKTFLVTVFDVAKSIITDSLQRRQKGEIILIPYLRQFKPSQKILFVTVWTVAKDLN